MHDTHHENSGPRDDADVLIIGSGFGGSVAAARFAQAGYSVTVLERGRRWRPGDFPRNPQLRDGWLWGSDRGLYDIRWLVGMIAVQASGWGGGSLAYANVFARPYDARLSAKWPAHLRRSTLDPFYDLAAHMLDVAPVGNDPATGQPPGRTALIEQFTQHGDRPQASIRPNLAVTFGSPDTWRPNKHGVPRRGCAFVGECVIGCNHGAKNSLDATYLAVAERHGARAVTHTQAIAIHADDTGYRVVTTTPGDPESRERTWRAPRVVVAAGAIGTTELLLRSRDIYRTLPRLSRRLGEGFSGNGDFLTLAELHEPNQDMTTGPTITTNTVVDVPEGKNTVWYQVQDGAFPVVLHELFDAVVPGQRARTWWRRRFETPSVRRVFAVLAMGHDSGVGTLRLKKSGDIVLAWRNRWLVSLYRSQRRLGPLLGKVVRVRPYTPLTWSALRRTTTVHPIGGVPYGASSESGVVNELGEVHGHPELFVMDGSSLPASTGVNPSATILAAAERSVQEIIRRDGHTDWEAPEWADVTPAPVPEDSAYAFAAHLQASTRGGGITFAETMRTHPGDPTPMTLRLQVASPSIDLLLEDRLHALTVTGTLDVGGVARDADTAGTLSLFPHDQDVAMSYTLHFQDAARRPWTLTGTKTLSRMAPWRAVRELTHLSAIVHPDGNPEESVRASLRIGAADLLALLSSIRGVGFTRARRLRSVRRFIQFFMQHTYRKSRGRDRHRNSTGSR